MVFEIVTLRARWQSVFADEKTRVTTEVRRVRTSGLPCTAINPSDQSKGGRMVLGSLPQP
eukprot:2273937-Prymnesium_polylepis.1